MFNTEGPPEYNTAVTMQSLGAPSSEAGIKFRTTNGGRAEQWFPPRSGVIAYQYVQQRAMERGDSRFMKHAPENDWHLLSSASFESKPLSPKASAAGTYEIESVQHQTQ
eukprot:4079460-Amphidinium_carterae.1